MKYRFNERNDIIGFIRELLYEFNLPTVDVVTDDKREKNQLYEGCYYIDGLNLSRYIRGSLRPIMPYYYNKSILNFTKKLSVNEHVYDSELHEYLGDYLRFMRDYNHIDLMPLYNCFSNKTIDTVNLSVKDPDNEEHSIFTIKVNDPSYKYYAVPVKFNQVYTISVDSNKPVEMACIIYDNVLVRKKSDDSFLNDLVLKTFHRVPSTNFSDPIMYDKLWDFDASKYIKYKDCLKLVIKLPINNESSVSVLEGNYLSTNDNIDGMITATGYFGPEDDKEYVKHYPTKLSLLRVNDNLQHPFADRLVEYLVDNAVTNIDEIQENVERIQFMLYRSKYKLTNKVLRGLYGIWHNSINDDIYRLENHSILNRPDVERYIFSKHNTILGENSEGVMDSEGNFRNIIDEYYDLLTYLDKDIEAYFIAAGGE